MSSNAVEEQVIRWLRRAEADLRVAEKLLELGEEPWIIVLHAQQVVEKMLKAYLVSRNRHFGKTHNLAKLIDQCIEEDPEFQYLYDIGVDELYPLAIEARYPDTEIEVTTKEAIEALEKAKKAKQFILRKINLQSY